LSTSDDDNDDNDDVTVTSVFDEGGFCNVLPGIKEDQNEGVYNNQENKTSKK